MSKKKEQKKRQIPGPKQESGVSSAPAEPVSVPQEDKSPQSAPPKPQRRMAAPIPHKWRWVVLALTFVFFMLTCFSNDSTAKMLSMGLIIVTIASCFLRGEQLVSRMSLPMAAVMVWVLLSSISAFYAISGKFGLRDVLRLLIGFCVFMLILAWTREGVGGTRSPAVILEGSMALAGLISIDTLSTHVLSAPFFSFFRLFSNDFLMAETMPLEVGVRMNSIYENPNVFAGIIGLGVLLSLSLAVSTEGREERRFHLCCLFINALSFVLVFSMGASGMIAVAFLLYLFLERKSRRGALLALMVETLVLVLLCAFPIFLTSFSAWSGFQPIPILCTAGGAALLCLCDQFVGQRVAGFLSRRGRLMTVIIAAILVLLCAFGALAVTLTGPARLSRGEGISRAAYPDAGTYGLSCESSGALTVTITSQNQSEAMMHTSTELYSGNAQGAEFTVPEDSLVVYFHIHAGEDLTLTSATYRGENGVSGTLPLKYRLLPGFIANRLQGIFANQNAIQRTVFFDDGLKLFRRSPIFGLGLGAYESGGASVQSFYYETKYVHNHYIETLASGGIIGLASFLAVFVLCAWALLKDLKRKEEADPLSPALAAALVFMALHAAVEVNFSFHYYLPYAFGVLALVCLCCGEELPLLPEGEKVRGWLVIGTGALLGVFGVILGLNMAAYRYVISPGSNIYARLESAAKMDLFEWADYELSYVELAGDEIVDKELQWPLYMQANAYAEHLATLDSNTVPPRLAQYYFATKQPERAFAMLEKYADWLPSSSKAWQEIFYVLEEQYDKEDTPELREFALEMVDKVNAWNEENMGKVYLSVDNAIFLAKCSDS